MEKFEEIVKSEKPVLVDFFATWCGPCKMMHPILEELHSSIGEKARIITVDTYKNEGLAAAIRVKTVPTLMIFKNGEFKWRETGVHSAAEYEARLANIY